MSPSKMRKTQWYKDGQLAFHMGEPRDAGERVGHERVAAFILGWDEAAADAEARTPTPVERILASVQGVDLRAERERTGMGLQELKARMTKDALASAVGAAETVADLRAILEALIEEAL